ncbi:MAG: hypothetical protein KDE27_28045 [Planctomycetes bacterium]|nr:hypothetical protein [Planctomycetota bacterium]
MLRVRTAAGMTALLGLAGCWRASRPAPAPFSIVRVSPAEVESGDVLLLNDSVTVHFSAALDPLSVTTASFSVLDQNGNPVPGDLRTGTNWVTFVPHCPLGPELDDGSFRPGEVYRLVVASYPRPDAVRATDGRRLAQAAPFELRLAPPGPFDGPGGRLPAPLRPPATELPFVLPSPEVPQQLPADAPRLQLHFTLPVLPTSVRPDAFVVMQLKHQRSRLAVRSARVISSKLDQLPGSTVEIDLGAEPRLHGGDGLADGERVTLQSGDMLSVSLATGPSAVRDLAGNEAFASGQWWQVVDGAALAILSWPAEDGGIAAGEDDWLSPGFEARSGMVRPRVCAEAGDGSLGLFRPQRDTVLRPGVPFDRGDGQLVQSIDGRFPFLAIDIGPDVRVRVEGSGSAVQLLACGGIRIAGELEFVGPGVPIPPLQHGAAAAELIEQLPLVLVAAGDVRLEGAITTVTPLPPTDSAIAIAALGAIRLAGELPYNTVLAVENAPGRRRSPIQGARGQTFATSVTFTPGLAPGARFRCRGVSPWRQIAPDRDRAVVRFEGVDGGLEVEWQAVPENPVEAGTPDRRPDRMPRPRAVHDGEWIALEPGSFVRFLIAADVGAGRGLPEFRQLRLADR